MAFHVPFSQRPSGRHQSQPIYIGFEPPRRARPKMNWWGFNGIFLFFLSLGLLSPVALLISLMGLRKRPRKLAVVGTGLSLAGSIVIASVIFSLVHEHNQRMHNRVVKRQKVRVAKQVQEGKALMAFAASEYEQFRDDHKGELPSDLDGSALALKHVDPWNNELMYEVNSDSAGLRSAGPDGKFFSKDDLVHPISGDTDRETLLPIEDGEVAAETVADDTKTE